MRLYVLAVRRAIMAIIGGPSAGLACGVTVASVLWVGATVPGLSLISGSGDATNERISISLQSALLGIDNRVGQSSPGADFAAARALGLTAADLQATPGLLDALSPHGASAASAAGDDEAARRGPSKHLKASRAASSPAHAVPVAGAATPVTASRPAPALTGRTRLRRRLAQDSSDRPPRHRRPRIPVLATMTADRARRPAQTGSNSSSSSGSSSSSTSGSNAGSGPSHTRGSPRQRRRRAAHRHSPADDRRSRRRARTGDGAERGLGLLRPAGCARLRRPPRAGLLCAALGEFVPDRLDPRQRCTARDAAGNAASLSFAVEVRDTTPPVIQIPPSPSVAATSPDGAVVTYSATAADLVDGTVPATCLPGSGSLFPVGSTQVTCTARDASGNTASAAFVVTVNGGDFTYCRSRSPLTPTSSSRRPGRAGADGDLHPCRSQTTPWRAACR